MWSWIGYGMMGMVGAGMVGVMGGMWWMRRRPEAWRWVLERKFGDGMKWVSGAELEAMLERGEEVVVLDARSEREQDVSMIPTAVRMDGVDVTSVDWQRIPPSAKIVVYCSVGFRSGLVVDEVRGMGYEDVGNLEGGIFGWGNQRRPLQTRRVHGFNRFFELFLDPEIRHPL